MTLADILASKEIHETNHAPRACMKATVPQISKFFVRSKFCRRKSEHVSIAASLRRHRHLRMTLLSFSPLRGCRRLLTT